MGMAPQREVRNIGLISFPDYESSMFLAYLSVYRPQAAFILSIETGFSEKYTHFYGDIERHVAYSRIESNQRDLTQEFMDGALNFVACRGPCALRAY
jgi:uncharacterized membrane protein